MQNEWEGNSNADFQQTINIRLTDTYTSILPTVSVTGNSGATHDAVKWWANTRRQHLFCQSSVCTDHSLTKNDCKLKQTNAMISRSFCMDNCSGCHIGTCRRMQWPLLIILPNKQSTTDMNVQRPYDATLWNLNTDVKNLQYFDRYTSFLVPESTTPF